MRQLFGILRIFFHSPLLCTFSCHPTPPTICPSSSHLILPSISWSTSQSFVPKFVYNTLFGILFSSILCTCPNQHNLFNLIVSIIVGFFKFLHKFLYCLTLILLTWRIWWAPNNASKWQRGFNSASKGLIFSNFLFCCHILGLKFFCTLSFQKASCSEL